MSCIDERDLLFGEISQERVRQDEEWGGADHDDEHEPLDWVRFIRKQCRIIENPPESGIVGGYESRMIKIAALALAAVESHRRRKA
jgi:hypothetical protein